MAFYKLIQGKLDQAGFQYEEEHLRDTDIIEYMVLEAAGALHPLQGKPLKCLFRQGHTSNIRFADGMKRSSLEFGLKRPATSQQEVDSFVDIVEAVHYKFPKSTVDSEHPYYNFYKTLYALILPDDDIERAIKSSALYVAAGNLSEFDLESLLLLKEKLKLYKIADDNLSALVESLVERIKAHLLKQFEPSLIRQALPQVERKFAAILGLASKEHQYNQLVEKFDFKLRELTLKGTKTFQIDYPQGPSIVQNLQFEQSYLSVAPIAESLRTTLKEAGKVFFNSPDSQDSFARFQRTCLDAIISSRTEFAKYRGDAQWYNELNPVLKDIIVCIKAIGGLLAAITVVPALLTEIYAEQGYIGTFFNYKTDSLRQLEHFEQDLSAEGGFFEELSEEISSAGMTV